MADIERREVPLSGDNFTLVFDRTAELGKTAGLAIASDGYVAAKISFSYGFGTEPSSAVLAELKEKYDFDFDTYYN